MDLIPPHIKTSTVDSCFDLIVNCRMTRTRLHSSSHALPNHVSPGARNPSVMFLSRKGKWSWPQPSKHWSDLIYWSRGQACPDLEDRPSLGVFKVCLLNRNIRQISPAFFKYTGSLSFSFARFACATVLILSSLMPCASRHARLTHFFSLVFFGFENREFRKQWSVQKNSNQFRKISFAKQTSEKNLNGGITGTLLTQLGCFERPNAEEAH